MFILTFLSLFLILSRGKARRNVDGNWDPFLFVSKNIDESPNYDITYWTRQLHLQQCAFVEIGEGFCALFVELRSTPASEVVDNSEVGEFSLGICACSTLRSWNLCSVELTRERKFDCIFDEATPFSNSSARVHRRLCDITSLGANAPACDCTVALAGQKLHKTEGFPTCYLNPLPESLCSPRGVCGIAQCSGTTIKGIHSPRCASNCHQRQPFCEEVGPRTSKPPAVNSVWSAWSSPKCNNSCGRGLTVAVALCHDQWKAGGGLPRTRIVLVRRPIFSKRLSLTIYFSSCPDGFGKCYCEVNVIDGAMRAARFTELCISIDGCIPGRRTFTFEGVLDNVDSGETYENDDHETFEDAQRDRALRPIRRRLLQIFRRNGDYELNENSRPNKNFKTGRGYRGVPRSRLDDDEDYDDGEEEDENDEDGESLTYEGDEADDADADDEQEEEDGEETIGLRGSAKGRSRKRVRVPRSDYAPLEGKPEEEVDELPEQGSAATESVTEACDDDEATEAPQYSDYDSSENSTSSKAVRAVAFTFGVKLVALNALIAVLG